MTCSNFTCQGGQKVNENNEFLHFWPKIYKFDVHILSENIEHTLIYLSNCIPVSAATLV